MKLLIDGYDKQTKTICANIRFCKDLQVLVYDPEKLHVEGMDLVLLQNVFTPEMEYNNGITTIPCDYEKDFKCVNDVVTYEGRVNTWNGSWIKSTLNIDKALEWCDCYACFDSIEWDLITAKNYDETAQKYVDKLNRIEWIKSKDKKLYLSHRLDKIFKEESNYYNMFNILLDDTEYNRMKSLANDVVNLQSNETDLKLVVGTYSCSGKFSLCLKLKEWYDTHNERTGIIFTENTADIINSYYIENNKIDESLIINASREWSDLPLDKWIEYVQYCVAWLESRGCKHILLQGQGCYGLHRMNKYYINENNTIMNTNNVILEHAIGCSSVAIAACVNMIDRLWDYKNYFEMGGVKLTDVYLSTYNHAKEFEPVKVDLCNGLGWLEINEVCNNATLMTAMNNLFAIDNNINFYTNDYLSQLLSGKEPYHDINYINYTFTNKLREIDDIFANFCDIYRKENKLNEFKRLLTDYLKRIDLE